MVGSNYPPGMSKRDFVRAGIDQPNYHECHEFYEVESSPVIEDGAAIFILECSYAEGEYGQGWKCEKERSYRFEYDVLETLDGEKIDVPSINEWKEIDKELEEVVIGIEQAWHDNDPRVDISVHPHEEHGEVTLSFLGYTLYFRP